MVAATQVYHSKVAHAIRAMAMFEAKKAVRRQLQAEGKKISWCLPKERRRLSQSAANRALPLNETLAQNGAQ
jgi:hypothetical protein